MERNTKTKEEIRKQLLKSRADLSEKLRQKNSEIIMGKIIAHTLFQRADTIYAYLSYNNEVDTWPLLSYALAVGKKVAVPKVLGNEMEFFYIKNLDEVQPGIKGIYEPEGTLPRLAHDEHALMIVPIVGFDRDQNRIGYGGGFYDRYLQKHPYHPTIGIAFSMQETELIPCERTDRRPDIILTEEKEVNHS